MPPAVAIAGAAVVGAGASIYAGSKAAGAQRDAANTAAAASERSTQLQVEEGRRQYDQTREDYAPYREAGYGALNALQSLYGIAPTTANGGTISTANATPWGNGVDQGAYKTIADKAPGGVDWAAYVAANPDAAAQWAGQTSDLASFNGDVNKFGAFHYVNDGARRDISAFEGGPATTAPATTTTPTTAGIPGPDYSSVGPAPTYQTPDYGGMGPAPTYTAPDYASVGPAPTYNTPDYSSFEESPGYQFRLKRGIDAVKANASMRGLLGSTFTMKNIEDFAEGQAADEYDAFYNRATAAADSDYARRRAAYDIGYDRATSAADADYNRRVSAYDTLYNRETARADADYNRAVNAYDDAYSRTKTTYDDYVNRLSALAGVGQTATAGTANAGQNASNVITAAFGQNGANQANAATAAGNATANAYTNLGSAITNGATNLASLYLYQQNGGFSQPYNRTGMI